MIPASYVDYVYRFRTPTHVDSYFMSENYLLTEI